MNLDTLSSFDTPTANGILAAAALVSAPNPGVGERPAVIRRYEREANKVLSEIRTRLKIADNNDSPEARASVSKVLAETLQQSILGHANTADILSRLGSAGRLWPTAYNVIQSKEFAAIFSALGIRDSHVEDAVKHPDDFQHLLTEGVPKDWRDISLFMKRVLPARDPNNRRWLLVQAHRIGIDQRITAAWFVYPNEVNIESAEEPLDVLKAFVEAFGVPLTVGPTTALFIKSEQFPAGSKIEAKFFGDPRDRFMSISHAINASGEVRIGAAYCIDLSKYRAALRRHGIKVIEPTGPQASVITTTTSQHAS
jgi:hypothetical protein